MDPGLQLGSSGQDPTELMMNYGSGSVASESLFEPYQLREVRLVLYDSYHRNELGLDK